MIKSLISGAEKIVEEFVRRDTKHVFIYPGGTIAPILDVIKKKTAIKIICPRNEQGAGYAALAYARLSGKPSVFMVTSGPGVTNAVTPIADAYFDNVPMVVLTGQVGTSDLRGNIPVKQRGFQECDTVGIFKSISKAVRIVTDTRELPKMMNYAFSLAQTDRKGPVVIDLPMDVQRTSLESSKFFPVKKHENMPYKISKRKITTLAQLLHKAERPIILAGGGVLAASAQVQLRILAERHGIPVAMSLPGVGAYPSNKALSLGLIGYVGSQYANLALYNADFVLCIGTTLHVRQTGSLPEKMAPAATIVRIDIDKHELAHSRVPLHLAIRADAKDALTALLSVVKLPAKGKTHAWNLQIENWKKQYPLQVENNAPLKPQYIVTLVNEIIRNKKDVVVATGVGQHQMWVSRHFQFDFPRRELLTSSGHGTMGFDLPAAIGAKIARPHARILCIVGDGSLQMNIQELATIVDLKLDIKIIVLDNHALNIVAQFQRQNWKSHPATGDKYNPNFADIAKAYGIWSTEIDSPRGAKKKLTTALERKGPALIHCTTDPREDILPMLLGGHTLNNMSFDSSF